jgi:F-type H+-transporting ATPase subunit alpha
VEILKQGQYSPMPVEAQVMSIYALTNGFIDEVPVNQVREWEKNFQEFMARSYPQVGNGIKTGKALTKEIEAELKTAIDAFNKTWTSTKNAGITKADL